MNFAVAAVGFMQPVVELRDDLDAANCGMERSLDGWVGIAPALAAVA